MALTNKNFVEKYYQIGSSMVEVILAISLILAVTPFLYGQISDMTQMVQDVHYARKIVSMRNNVITFIRINESEWEKTDENPELTAEQVQEIAPGAKDIIIDKQGDDIGTVDVYLVFPKRETNIRSAKVAKYIGTDAAVVQSDGIAYAQNWAVQDEEKFEEGDLIFKVSRDYTLENRTRYLHRESINNDGLTTMLTDLHMNNNYMYNIGTMSGDTLNMANTISAKAKYLYSDSVEADNVKFSDGVNFANSTIGAGAITSVNTLYGFNIEADTVNQNTNQSVIITKSATVNDSINIGNDLIVRFVDGKTTRNSIQIEKIFTNGLSTSHITAKNMNFVTKETGASDSSFGITIASDLWPSSSTSVKGLTLGTGTKVWYLSDNPIPVFDSLTLTAGSCPTIIELNSAIMQ